jgi:phosphate/sulfate permease
MAGPDPTQPRSHEATLHVGQSEASPTLAGLIAGILAAVVWAFLVYVTHNTISLAAWGVGGVVGLAVAKPAREPHESRSTTAVVLAAVAVVLAKALILGVALPPVIRGEILQNREATAALFMVDMAGHRSFSPALQTAIDSLARERHDSVDSEGSAELQFRMISEARERAAAASPAERERLVRAAMGGLLARFGFLPLLGRSFGAFDLLWLGLGLSTAWKLGQAPSPRPSFGPA